MRSNRRVLSVVAAAAVVAASSTVLDARSALSTQGWSVYKNERYGYRLSYPGGLFNPAETPNKESGAIWTTAEGARLIATAINALPGLLDQLDAAEAVLVRVRELHRESRGSMSALYPNPICECGKDYPCLTVAALGGELS